MPPKDCVEPLCTLGLWDEPDFLIRFLDSVGLSFVPKLAKNFRSFRHDNALTKLLVEYYVVEDDCFKINDKKLYIGLVDVNIGTGLRVDGRPVTCNLVKNWRQLCDTSFGFDLPNEAFDKDSRGKPKPKLMLTWLRDYFKNMLATAGGNLKEGTEPWKRYIRAYWMYFIGCYVAPDSSKGKVSVEYLGLLHNVEDIGLYAWGAASLTKLIEGLKKKKVNTLAAFLMVFMLEFIQPLRQKLLGLIDSPPNLPTDLPLLSPWGGILSTVFSRTVHMNQIVEQCKGLLDNLDEVENNPYSRLDLRVYRDHLVTACRDTICIHMCEVHAHRPSKFHMQYGYRTLVPSSTSLPPTEPIFKKMGPKEDCDVLGNATFKRFVEAWEKIDPLKGELLDGWSAENAPWLVEETVQVGEPADTAFGGEGKMSLINENSTTKEILSEIRYTFMAKEFEEYQGIVIRREEDLKTELKKLKEDYDFLKEERNLLERNHCSSEIVKLELEEELKKVKNESDSLKKKRCLFESEQQFSDQNWKKPKIETDVEPVMDDLRRENNKLKEEIELYRKKFPEHVNRMACIEETLADLREKYASSFRAENADDDHRSPGENSSSRIRNYKDSTNSHPQKEAILIEPAAAYDVEVSLSTAPVNRAEPPVTVIDIDSDDD